MLVRDGGYYGLSSHYLLHQLKRIYHWSIHTLQALCVAYCVGSIALGHIIWQKCLYKQSSWSADADIWFGIKQSVASHLLSYARVLERWGFHRYCPITLSGIWKIGISLDICHWNCCPNPQGPFRFWHQNPNKGRGGVLFFSHCCWFRILLWSAQARRPKRTCLTKSDHSSRSCLYESVRWLLKSRLLMSCGAHTSLAWAWWLCRNSRGFCLLSSFCLRDQDGPLHKGAKIVKIHLGPAFEMANGCGLIPGNSIK